MDKASHCCVGSEWLLSPHLLGWPAFRPRLYIGQEWDRMGYVMLQLKSVIYANHRVSHSRSQPFMFQKEYPRYSVLVRKTSGALQQPELNIVHQLYRKTSCTAADLFAAPDAANLHQCSLYILHVTPSTSMCTADIEQHLCYCLQLI